MGFFWISKESSLRPNSLFRTVLSANGYQLSQFLTYRGKGSYESCIVTQPWEWQTVIEQKSAFLPSRRWTLITPNSCVGCRSVHPDRPSQRNTTEGEVFAFRRDFLSNFDAVNDLITEPNKEIPRIVDERLRYCSLSTEATKLWATNPVVSASKKPRAI